jgi:branched-chain amino acid transport system ATP-binding protein
VSTLELIDVRKDFSKLVVLRGIDMSVEEGARHAIIGPNGAGKTTLFNVITGKHHVSSGQIIFKGLNISGYSAHVRNRLGLARSFQINNAFFGLDVFENVRSGVRSRFGLRYSFISGPGAKPEIDETTWRILKQVGLAEFADVPARELSYGRQRALEIAMALSTDPELILLDEPTAGMTREETLEAVEIIERVTAGRTLIIIEHDMEVVFSLADTVTVLHNGIVLVSGPPDLVRQDERVKDAYLGSD